MYGLMTFLFWNLLLFTVCDRIDALHSVLQNLEVYEKQTRAAKDLGADIIVFPEVILWWNYWQWFSMPDKAPEIELKTQNSLEI